MKHLTPNQFCKAMVANLEKLRIVHVGGGLWQAQCPVGVLANPQGVTSFGNLTVLLATLAGAGIRTIRVEWDGLPAIASETNPF